MTQNNFVMEGLKFAAATAVSALATFCVMWFTVVEDRPSRTEVAGLIQTTAPYIQDRAVLVEGTRRNAEAIDAINKELREVAKNQVRLETKIDLLLDSR